MTVHRIQRLMPSLINYNGFSNNGEPPGAAHIRRIAQAHNHWANWQPKCFLALPGSTSGSAGTATSAHAAGVTGHGTHTVTALVGVIPPNNASASNPFVELKYRAHGDASWSSGGTVHYHGGVVLAAVPADIHHGAIQFSVESNTHYEFKLELNDYTGIKYCSIVETPSFGGVDDSDRGIVNPTHFVGEGDIEDAAVQDLIDASNDLVRHNRAHLLSWTQLRDSSWPSTTSASYVEINGSSPALIHRLDLSNHDSENARGVPVVFGVYVHNSTPDGGIRLRNTTDGSTVAEIKNPFFAGDSRWVKTSARITPSDIDGDDLEIQFKSNGSNPLEIQGVTLYEYEYDWSPALTHSLDLEASSSQYAEITDANQNGILDQRTNLTIECAVKFESLPSDGDYYPLVSKWGSSGSFGYYLQLYNDSGTYKLRLGVSDDGTNAHIGAATWSGATTGSWVHLAGTFDPVAGTSPSAQIALYVDGSSQTVSDVADDSADRIADSGAAFRIGGIAAASKYLDGKICDVRLWREVRTSSEIAAWDDKDLQLHAGLVGHWFKTETPNDLTDHSNDLTLSGSPSYSTDTPY